MGDGVAFLHVHVQDDLLGRGPGVRLEVEGELAAGELPDGLRTTLSPRTLHAIRAHVTAFGTCSEEAIVRLAGDAGFSRFRQVTQTPVNVVLELRP